jgi:homoserine dehydrogenase
MSINIGIAGLGTVSSALIKIIEEKSHLLESLINHKKITIKAVASRSKKPEFDHLKWYDSPLELADDKNIDIVVELIGGEDGIAYDLCKKSLTNKKHVVTANKALIALHGNELASIAEKNNVSLLFESAVAGAIPIIKTLKENLAVKFITEVSGILNGTCNYVLSEMTEHHQDFAPTLAEAQKLGFAESDPSFDVDGVDAAHKITIISALAFKTAINFSATQISGIREISLDDIKAAKEFGYVIKHLGICRLENGKILQKTSAFLIPQDHKLANINGSLNSIMILSDLADETIITGRGAGGKQTASAVISDIIDISANRQSKPFGIAMEDQNQYEYLNEKNEKKAFFVRSSKALDFPNSKSGDYGFAAIVKDIAKTELKEQFKDSDASIIELL